jgi:hypothetical protein
MFPTKTQAEALETTRIHRVAGLTGDRTALVTTRPFRAPHHTIADAGLIGGGRPVKNVTQLSRQQARCSPGPVPGQVSVIFHKLMREPALLAGEALRVHHCVHILEAFPECRRPVLAVSIYRDGKCLDVRQARRERRRVRGTEDGAHRRLCRAPP